MNNFIGKKFGSYIVRSQTINEKDKGRKYYILNCENCDREYIRSTRDLNNGNVKKCYCERYIFIDDGNKYIFNIKGKDIFISKDDNLKREVEEEAWHIDNNGYAVCGNKINGKIVKKHLHRFVMEFYEGESHLSVDHIDRNRLNNTYINLRYATRSEQQLNKNISINNSSGLTGVHFNKYNKWVARLQIDGKRLQKIFDTYEEAVEQRLRWENLYIELDKFIIL